MGVRRKATDDDTRTLTKDIPKVIMFIAPLALLAAYHQSGGGYRPTEGKHTGDLRGAGVRLAALSAEANRLFADTDAAWAKFFGDLKDIRAGHAASAAQNDFTRLHRAAGTLTPGIEARIAQLNHANRYPLDGGPVIAPSQIEHSADRIEAAPREAAQPCDRGYDTAPGVIDGDDGAACAPVPLVRVRAQVRLAASPAALKTKPIYLMAPQIPDVASVQRKLTMYAAGFELPGGAAKWFEGLAGVAALWLAMKWALRKPRERAAFFILGVPLAVAAVLSYLW